MSSSGEPRAIAIAIVRQRDWFLVGRRPLGVPLAGYWEFPGGKVHKGELEAEAAVRECREETSLAVRVLRRLPDHVRQYDHGSVHLNFFLCEPLAARPWPQAPFHWVPRAVLQDLEFPGGNAQVVELLVRRGE